VFSIPIPTPRDALVALAVAGLCLPLGYCSGKRAGVARMEAARAVANVEALRTDGSAKELAAVERANDNAAVAAKREDLLDAVADLPDSTPTVRRVVLACARLRSQGTDTTTIPACRGPATPR
jgi:hypothetical protein